jgi:hypothetical protein
MPFGEKKLIEDLFKQMQGKLYALHDTLGHFLSEEDKEIIEIMRCLLGQRKTRKMLPSCKCAKLAKNQRFSCMCCSENEGFCATQSEE